MTQYGEKLSAFLDGELPDTELREIEQALANDPALQVELEALMAAETVAQNEFATMLEDPVPVELVAAIRNAPSETAANSPIAPSKFGWLTAAAVVAALAVGGTFGYLGGASQGTQVASAPGWLADIADYHRVYSGQTRHLVEVQADEAEHIQVWLSKTVGAEVHIPDLSQHGLTFQGARLLVAAGKPVSQLMYMDANMRIVALCQIRSETPQKGFKEQNASAFDMVIWGGETANFVIVGDEGRQDLKSIAQTAAVQT